MDRLHCLSIDGHLGYLLPFGYSEYCYHENSCTSIHLDTYFYIIWLYKARSTMTRSYNFLRKFFRNHQLFFHSSCTILHSHQQYARVLIFLHLCQYLLSFFFFTRASLVGVMWYFIMVLLHISLMINDANIFSCK